MTKTQTTDPASDVLTVAELSRRWKCNRHTIHREIHAGNLRAFRLGKRTYRVAIGEIIRYETAKAA